MKYSAIALALLLSPMAACASKSPRGPETSGPSAATHRVCGTVMLSRNGGMPSPDPGWTPTNSEDPLPEATVLLFQLADPTRAPGAEIGRTESGADGSFCFDAPAGGYVVAITESSLRHLMDEERLGFKAHARADVTVVNDDVRDLVLRMNQSLPQ